MPDVTITGIKTVPSINPARIVKGEKDTMLTYTIDGATSFVVILEGGEPTDEQIKKAIAQDVKVQQFKGKVYKI